MTTYPLIDVNCEFCRIVAGEEPGEIVFETQAVLAFLPLKPASVGHTLVIPKRHIEDLWHLEPDIAAPLINAVVLLSRAIKAGISPDGMNLINSMGAAASQTVGHLHMHLVPRWFGDHIGNIWPETEPCSQERKEGIAESIREAVSECMHNSTKEECDMDKK